MSQSLVTPIVLAAVCTLASLISVNAHADDDWSGSYVGASLGKRFLDVDWQTTRYQDPSGADMPFFDSDPSASLDSGAWLLNVFVGRNWMTGPAKVVGVELRMGKADNDQKQETIPGALSLFSSVHVESGFEASIRGRIGYLPTPKVLLYGSLGIAAVKADVSVTCRADGIFCNPGAPRQHKSESDTLVGWTASVGIETLLSENLFVRFDYSHDDYGDIRVRLAPNPDRFGITADVDMSADIVSLSLGYRF